MRRWLRAKRDRSSASSSRAEMGYEPYSSYQAALNDCAGGYTSSDLLDCIYLGQKAFYHIAGPFPEVPWYLTAELFAALPLAFTGAPLHVLDFGGSVGMHFMLTIKLYPSALVEKWAVVETAEMVARASELSGDRLKFFSDVEEAAFWLGSVDLLTSSGAVQYTPDPFAYLSKLLDMRAPVFAVHRSALSLIDETFVTIQRSRLRDNARGPLPKGFIDREVRYPITYISKKALFTRMSERYRQNLHIMNEGEVLHCGRPTRSEDTIIWYDPQPRNF